MIGSSPEVEVVGRKGLRTAAGPMDWVLEQDSE